MAERERKRTAEIPLNASEGKELTINCKKTMYGQQQVDQHRIRTLNWRCHNPTSTGI